MFEGRQSARAFAAMLGLYLLGSVLPFLASKDPLAIDLDARLLSPSKIYLFGTDDLGRDLLSRVLHGFSTTVTVSVAALVSSLMIGILIGLIAGYYYRRWPDALFNWVVNLIFSLPFLLVMAAVLSLTTPSLGKAYIVLTGIMWVGPARIVRAEVTKTLPLGHVVAERAMGSPEWRILKNSVLPVCVRSATIFSFTYLPEVIGLEAGLSFLGLGAQPPEPALGKMIFDGLNHLYSAWWIVLFPALALLLLVVAINIAVWGTREA